MTSFDFQDGGRFICSENLNLQQWVDLILLLAALVIVSGCKKGQFAHAVYAVLPELIVNFSKSSRFDGGFWLLKHAMYHAMDARMPSLLCGTRKICVHKDLIKLLIKTHVQTSMKTNMYDITIAFTMNAHHVCVHILVVIILLTMLLYDDLAEHVLYELSVMFQ